MEFIVRTRLISVGSRRSNLLSVWQKRQGTESLRGGSDFERWSLYGVVGARRSTLGRYLALELVDYRKETLARANVNSTYWVHSARLLSQVAAY